MSKEIYLVRHGKVDYGEKKCYIGFTDLPLCDEGIDQARKLKCYFSDIDIDKAYVSPLSRCLQTSEIILAERNIERILLDELKEINMGEWEGKSFEYIKTNFPKLFETRGNNLDTFMPPGGESFSQLQMRVIPVFDNIIRSTTGNVLIVAHAGVNRVILGKLLDVPLNGILNICQPYGCINRLSWDEANQKWQYERVF